MKLLAYLLITASLIVGTIAASTAYLVDIGTSDSPNDAILASDGDDFARLSSPAGVYKPLASLEDSQAIALYQEKEDAYQEEEQRAIDLLPADDDATAEEVVSSAPEALPTAPTGEALLAKRERQLPIGRPNDRVTEELLALLRDSDPPVRYIRVSGFSFERWFGAPGGYKGWAFVACAIGLFIGAMVVRNATKKEIAATRETDTGEHTGATAVFNQINNTLDTLQRDLSAVQEPKVRNAMIVERLSVVQRDHAPAFIADRPALIGALGLGGFAELMDRFAALERQINRAWSAAADEHEDEAITSLYRALALIPEVAQKLPR